MRKKIKDKAARLGKKVSPKNIRRKIREQDRHTLIRYGIALALWGFAFFALLTTYLCYDLPDITDVKPLESKPSITIVANDGAVIARFGGMKGSNMQVKDLPKTVAQAVMAVEDRRFYNHFGIDIFGLARAMAANVAAGQWVQGGSTITQQLAKNLFLTPEKTLRRKAQEAIMAVYIDYKFSKDDILSAYLNRVYFGAGAYGIDAAARTYFGKSARDLNLWESAVLAGLLKAPSRFSPATNPKLSRERAETVLAAMVDAGYITEKKQKQELKNVQTRLAKNSSGDLARYFADWVLSQLDSYILESPQDIIVKTTFSPRLQVLAEKQQKDIFARMKPTDKISQVALVTLSKDGAVRAMIGGTDYAASQFNRATQALRQPGSAFKPFVYLAALEAGFEPDTTILDEKFKSGSYRPDNYDGRYYGEVTLTQALAHSLNAATIRLLQDVGIGRFLDVTERMGFAEKVKPELASGLGADEVTLLELTKAYAVIGNGGHIVYPYAILSVENNSGEVLYERPAVDTSQVFSSGDIQNLDRMLQQVVAQGTGGAAQLSRGLVAGKTGTTQNYRDAWFIGYTDNLVTGVWMGNDDNESMDKVTGGKYPAMLWRAYMNDAIDVDMPRFQPSSSFFFNGGTTDRTASPGGGFSDMINRWSQGTFGAPTAPAEKSPLPYNP